VTFRADRTAPTGKVLWAAPVWARGIIGNPITYKGRRQAVRVGVERPFGGLDREFACHGGPGPQRTVSVAIGRKPPLTKGGESGQDSDGRDLCYTFRVQ